MGFGCGKWAWKAWMLLSLLVPLAFSATPSGAPVSGLDSKHPVSLSDIVAAFPADENHVDVAKASRIWRRSIIRAFIANNNPPSKMLVEEGLKYNETWSYYPDDHPRRSLYAGDTRAALVPFLAHRHFGETYRWLLYMDDDTVFIPPAVQRLLARFDSEMPYFLSDHFWYMDKKGQGIHPNRRAPRCLPCGYNVAVHGGAKPAFPAPIGCPCTPRLLCDASPASFNEFCDMPRFPNNTYSMHGGAGGIMSIGLMRQVDLSFMERCVHSLHSTGGDAFISICLWQAGYGFTDPGGSLFDSKLQSFDPGPEDRLGAMRNLAAYIDGHHEGPDRHWVSRCDATCEAGLDAMVSLHARSRAFSTLQDAASFIRGLFTLYDLYLEIRVRREGRAQALAAAAEGRALPEPKKEEEGRAEEERSAARAAAEAQQASEQASAIVESLKKEEAQAGGAEAAVNATTAASDVLSIAGSVDEAIMNAAAEDAAELARHGRKRGAGGEKIAEPSTRTERRAKDEQGRDEGLDGAWAQKEGTQTKVAL